MRIKTALTANTYPAGKATVDRTAMFMEKVNQTFFISPGEFARIFNTGLIADGRGGGLVIGRRHYEGHIPLVRMTDKGYEFFATMEGGEFLLNHDASIQFADELETINSQSGIAEDGFAYFEETLPRIIDARSQTTKMVLTDGSQFIVNRLATKQNIERLSEINETFNGYTVSDPFDIHFRR